MTNRTTLLTLILIIIAVASSALMILSANKKNISQSQNNCDAFMQNVIVTSFSKTGLIKNHIKTPLLKHYHKDNATYFTKPNILVYTQNRIPWYATARFGTSSKGNHQITLHQHVRLHQPSRPNHPATTILSNLLTLFPKTSTASTPGLVTMIRPNSVIKGVGADANLKTGVVHLLSHTHAVIKPQDKS